MHMRAAQHLASAVVDMVLGGADTLSWELRLPSPGGASDQVSVELDATEISTPQARAFHRLPWVCE